MSSVQPGAVSYGIFSFFSFSLKCTWDRILEITQFWEPCAILSSYWGCERILTLRLCCGHWRHILDSHYVYVWSILLIGVFSNTVSVIVLFTYRYITVKSLGLAWFFSNSKVALNWSKVTVKTFILLQKITISNKCCSFELFFSSKNLGEIPLRNNNGFHKNIFLNINNNDKWYYIIVVIILLLSMYIIIICSINVIA